MILKERENLGADIEALEALRSDPRADSRVRREIEEQIRKLKSGERGEATAAFELKVHYGQSRNWVVIHDLRIEHDGVVAQIDHLLIGRMLDVWVCESKNFSNGVTINDLGEFETTFNGKSIGISSPIEQNFRHMLILRSLFTSDTVRLPKRLGLTIRPRFHSLVLISNGSISRPKTKVRGIETVIKSEHARNRISRLDESINTMDITKLVSFETLENIGHQLLALHRPIVFNWETRLRMKTVAAGVPHDADVHALARMLPTLAEAANSASDTCQNCGADISPGVRAFCRSNAVRFGGAVYCMPCQSEIPR